MEFLLNGDFDPITWRIGFMKAPCEDVMRSCVSRQNRMLARNGLPENQVRPASGSLRRMLGALLPLCSYPVNWLVLDCVGHDGSEWTAYFDNLQSGPDHTAFIPLVAREMGVCAVSFILVDSGLNKSYGFSFWNPGDSMPSRSVLLSSDQSVWDYYESGSPLPLEGDAFRRKKPLRDSFGVAEVLGLASRLGLRPADPQFFESATGSVTGYLVKRPIRGSVIKCRPIEDVRRFLGID